MDVRERTMEWHREMFSPYACGDDRLVDRERPMAPCPLRTDFQRDRDRILHCKAFRRMKHKTQCFLAPEGDHFRTRLTHTLEVAQIARTAARALRLNEDLTEAIALGHDLGHTPFGHMGERILDALCPQGFSHAEQSLRVVERLENDGKGLNLTLAVRDGIREHTSKGHPRTLEGAIRLPLGPDRLHQPRHRRRHPRGRAPAGGAAAGPARHPRPRARGAVRHADLRHL